MQYDERAHAHKSLYSRTLSTVITASYAFPPTAGTAPKLPPSLPTVSLSNLSSKIFAHSLSRPDTCGVWSGGSVADANRTGEGARRGAAASKDSCARGRALRGQHPLDEVNMAAEASLHCEEQRLDVAPDDEDAYYGVMEGDTYGDGALGTRTWWWEPTRKLIFDGMSNSESFRTRHTGGRCKDVLRASELGVGASSSAPRAGFGAADDISGLDRIGGCHWWMP
ncbi:hypothetical protein DFP72DRAFT_1045383 [Ephemerocybe angulata]|uniref:Uncharacterized protein n=1 Tax=Ephemerocybe angulata TaxID=980116 RepID=A0A8H6I1F1_9AGAR|nr:hypothetical protein DFP72DRAFT_1045383 [Tulosesus angulatus]